LQAALKILIREKAKNHLSGLNSFLAIADSKAIMGPTQSTCAPGSQFRCEISAQAEGLTRES
jgi:hypothetical protein